MAIGTIIVVAGLIKTVADATSAVIKAITDIKNAIRDICNVDMQQVWGSNENVDSQVFKTRMQELETDIQTAYSILNEYEQLLEKSAKDYEKQQQSVRDQASALQRPTSR